MPPLAYLTLPADLRGPADLHRHGPTAWQQPARSVDRRPCSATRKATRSAQTAARASPSHPKPDGQLTDTKASSPAGYNFRLSNDNNGFTAPNLRAPAQAKTAVVALPAGVTINPSLGAGLIGLHARPVRGGDRLQPARARAARTARRSATSASARPLFDELIDGAIYLAQPDDPATPTPGRRTPSTP